MTLLLGKGANPLAKCKDGTTPLELCRSTAMRKRLLRIAEGTHGRTSSPLPATCSVAGGLLASLRADGGRHADVVLACGGEELRCHALVLAAQGDYWEALFFGLMAQCEEAGALPLFTSRRVSRCCRYFAILHQ